MMVSKRELQDKQDVLSACVTMVTERVIEAVNLTLTLVKGVISLSEEVERQVELQEAMGDDIDRLHDSIDMWASEPLKDRVASLESSVYGEYPKTCVTSSDEEEEENQEKSAFISLHFDGDLTVLSVGKHQQLILDDEELEAVTDLLKEWE